jgi:osmotically-inducible protein OsmY
MKTRYIFAIASTLLIAGNGIANEADDGLEKTLRANINEKHVDIDVHKGIVKLEGHVPNEAVRQRIDAEVRTTPGVVGVQDELKVDAASPATPGAYTTTIPIYQAPLPEVAPATPVITMPPPVVIAEYPHLKLQPWTTADQETANRIGYQLHANQVPTAWLQDTTITVRSGNVWVRGIVDSQEQHDMIISSLQRTGGILAIYDQLQVRR